MMETWDRYSELLTRLAAQRELREAAGEPPPADLMRAMHAYLASAAREPDRMAAALPGPAQPDRLTALPGGEAGPAQGVVRCLHHAGAKCLRSAGKGGRALVGSTWHDRWDYEPPLVFAIERRAVNAIYRACSAGPHAQPPDRNDQGCVWALNLGFSNLEGRISRMIGELRHLEALHLHHNEIRGRIPRSMKRLTKLRHLSLFGNALLVPPAGCPLHPVGSDRRMSMYYTSREQVEEFLACL